MNLKIVVDENIPFAQQMFGDLGEVIAVAGRTMRAEDLSGADVLLVRSVTQVNEQLLSQSALRFIGSATIGTDHVDLAYLRTQGIPFANAPGCNAHAVVDYDLCCLDQLLCASDEYLLDKTVAVIGVGNVGQRLVDRLEGIGVEVLKNDPYRAQHESGFASLEAVLSRADIVCLHTPLSKAGAFPSHHLMTLEQLNLLKQGAILLNAGRGPVICAADLQRFLNVRDDVRVVLDVWEHEPKVDQALADKVSIATPHIAGYSLEGKVRGSFMLKQAMSEQLGFSLHDSLDDYLPAPSITKVHIGESCQGSRLMKLQYDPYSDDRAFRASLSNPDQVAMFDQLRKNYPVRREFSALYVSGGNAQQQAQLRALGFTISG